MKTIKKKKRLNKRPTKKNNVKPTLKQKRAFKKLVENGGNKSKAMLDAGYSYGTANTPQKLTESKGWKMLQDKYFPKDKISKLVKEGFEATKVQIETEIVEEADEKGKLIEKEKKIKTERPDLAMRHKYLETACKLRGLFPKENGDVNNNINVFSLADLADKNTKTKQLGFEEIQEVEFTETDVISDDNE